jgi:hypothetical protein
MVSRVASTRFSAELERAGKTSARLRVPVDLKELYGCARPPLRVTIRGHTWRTTPGVYGSVAWIGLNKDVRAAAGVDAGDRVRVTMELDAEPRRVDVPDDLRTALRADPVARAAFAKLSFTHGREYVQWVEEAKRPETRARRIAATVERVRAGGPPP